MGGTPTTGGMEQPTGHDTTTGEATMSTITVTIAIDGDTFNEHSVIDMGRDAADMRTIAARLAPEIRRAMIQDPGGTGTVYRQTNHGVELADGEPFTRGMRRPRPLIDRGTPRHPAPHPATAHGTDHATSSHSDTHTDAQAGARAPTPHGAHGTNPHRTRPSHADAPPPRGTSHRTGQSTVTQHANANNTREPNNATRSRHRRTHPKPHREEDNPKPCHGTTDHHAPQHPNGTEHANAQ